MEACHRYQPASESRKMSVYISSLCLGHDLSRVRAAQRLGSVLTGHGRSDTDLFVLGRGWLSFSLFGMEVTMRIMVTWDVYTLLIKCVMIAIN